MSYPSLKISVINLQLFYGIVMSAGLLVSENSLAEKRYLFNKAELEKIKELKSPERFHAMRKEKMREISKGKMRGLSEMLTTQQFPPPLKAIEIFDIQEELMIRKQILRRLETNRPEKGGGL